MKESMKSAQFAELQFELFGEKAMKKLKHVGSSHDLEKLKASVELSKQGRSFVQKETIDVSDEDSQGDFGDFMEYRESDSKKVAAADETV